MTRWWSVLSPAGCVGCPFQRSLVAPYHAILRCSRSHIAQYLLREVSTPPKWCDTPPWHLVSHRHICVIPHFATFRSINVRYAHKIKHARVLRHYRYTLRLQVSRDMKSITAGPISRGAFTVLARSALLHGIQQASQLCMLHPCS